MDAESGIGTASRAAPESRIEVFPRHHATPWYSVSKRFYQLPCGRVFSNGSGVWHRYG